MSDANAVAAQHEVSSYADAMAVLKDPVMVQALYDAGRAVMADALITLHGEEHSQRRIVEFGVFGRGFFRDYQREVFPAALAPVLAPYVQAGRADLIELGYRVTMNLTADLAGIDRRSGTVEETEALLQIVRTFSSGATLAHSTLDHDAVNAAVAAAMAQFDDRFLEPSIQRRRQLLSAGEPLPNDVLSKLLTSDRLQLADDVLRREIAFYLQAGAHSTANATVHALHNLLEWVDGDAARRQRLVDDPAWLQRCVHESLRLHPASPVALRRARRAATVAGLELAEGDLVTVNLHAANRDQLVFGADAERFNPSRELDAGVWPFGLTFGYGIHACLGRDLDGGVVAKPGAELQMGIVPMMVQALLKHGASWIPEEPPVDDPNTERAHFGSYPVKFDLDLVA